MVLRPVAVLAAALIGLGLIGPAAADEIPDPPSPTAQLEVTKETSADGPVGPGDSFTYTIQISCSAIDVTDCQDAITTDAVPEPLVIDNVVPSGPNSAAPPDVDGQNIRVDWTEPLDGGNEGMTNGTTSQVQITVHVPDDVSYDYDGQTLTNTAIGEATNTLDDDGSADVTLDIPLDLETTASKTLTPATALAAAGTDVAASLGGTNDSNATVDTLVIQDPVDPDATPNPFTYLGFQGFGDVSPPDTTDSTTYEVYVGGAWVTCTTPACPGIDPADVQGTRVTFDGTFPPGAEASVGLDLQTTDEAAALPEDTTVTNDVQSEVDLDDQSATDTDSADFNFQANDIEVEASKSFDPDVVIAGESSTATIGGSNTSAIPIDSMTITEPSAGSFPDEYTFGGFTTGITYPEGATSATVTYQPSGEVVAFDDGAIPPPPAGGPDTVTSFEIDFEGDIQPGAEASAEAAFDVDTDADLTGLPISVNNEVAVEGENDGATGDDTADDDLYIYDTVIEPYVDKQIRPSQIVDVPGQIATVTLQGGTTERPDPPDDPTGTTGDADHIVLQDPSSTPIEGDEFWNAFDLDSITATPIPADASLTIYYYDTSDPTGGPDGDGWKVLTGPVDGPEASFSYDVPGAISDVAGGVRFDYEYTGADDGFPPGTDLEPNFTVSLRDTGRYTQPPYNSDPANPDTVLTNCAATDATSPVSSVPDASSPPACDTIDILPTDGQGSGNLIDKAYGESSSGGNKSVIERSGDTIPSTLSWSTGGRTGLETVDITDVADPEGTDVADSVYDAFNLIRVQPITAADDPLLEYDQITGVQVYDGSDWVDATNDPCPAACDGTFPGMDLTAAEQESTLGVRLTYAESPTRADTAAGDLDAPPVGSGVARSLPNDRDVTLVWQIRDTKRSDGSPALAVDDYNQPDNGVVRNTADATGYPQDGSDPVSDQDFDDVVITDVPITSTTDKTWAGGPLGVPEPGTPADEYPLSRVSVTTTNTTPLMVDQLQITDTAPGSTGTQDPFDYFDLDSFAGIVVPEGATDTTVTITCVGGTVDTFTRDEALALTPSTMPCDGGTTVETVQVLFDGRIVTEAQGVLQMDLRLRATNRSTDQPITADDGPIVDTAQGVVADVDPIGDCPPDQGDRYACDNGTDGIALEVATYDIDADKSIAPASQKEGDDSPVTVTIGEQSSGSARPYIEELEDDDASFWNAMDFVQMDPSWTLPTPVEHVQACYKTGGAFTVANVESGEEAVGGDWTCQQIPSGGPPFEDDELTLQQAKDFIAGAPAGQVHGLRFRFMAGNEAGWQNPSHPHIQVPFQVQRRDALRTGGPVPTTRSDSSPAPGEDVAGVFDDTVDVQGESVLVGNIRLTADDSADATYTYEHLTVGVEVDKGPSGQVQPGVAIPFTLTYTNTGEAPLTNPVFTDTLPSDADGPLLIFDPDAAPGSSPYSFDLEGEAPDPPDGDPLPTDEDQITITQDPAAPADPETITFAMPDGTVLEPGQTYTITIELVLRPGLTPDDLVTNTDAVIADEPFDPDACSPNYDPDTGECWDDTTVSPVRVAALSTVKKVKADVPVEESGIPEIYLDRDVLPADSGIPDDYCDTAADANGFYRAPCVPMTYPGDTETWRYQITNSGTLPIDELVSIDVLPHTGDSGVIVDLPRGSEWTPTFADTLAVVDSSGTPIADITQAAYYSTSYTPCTDDLNPLGTPCPEGEWLPYTADTDPSTVKSVKTVLTFPDGELFAPGDEVALQAKTRTTPETLATGYPVAWNTVATGGVSNDNGTRARILPIEGRKVGVTYPTGPIQLQKTVSGDGAAYAPDSFQVNLTCTSAGQPVDLDSVNPITLVPGDDPFQVDGLPFGAECTATEADQGQTSQSIDTATVGGPDDDIGVVSINNVFDVGSLTVTKAVTSDAVDQDGNPITYGPFQVAVSCEFLGDEVWADGYSEDNPMEAEIGAGGTVTFEGLPTGAECTVTEPGDADAARTTIAPDQPVTIGDDEPVTVSVENDYDVGSLRLRKFVSDAALQYPIGQGPFTLHVACTLTDASHPDGELVYDADVELTGGEPGNVATIDDLATGAVCDITEPDPGDATAHVITPNEVTIGADTTARVVATNLFRAGSLTVTKAIVGPGADLYGAGPFEVSLDCTYTDVDGDVQPLNTPGGNARTLSADNDFTATYDPLLLGSTCHIEETRTGGATDSVITDADGNEVSDITIDSPTEPLQLDVTNTFDVGKVKVHKVVRGPGAGPYTVALACTYDVDGKTTKVDIPGGAERNLTQGNDLSAVYEDLPAGAECTLKETEDGGARTTTITPNDGDPAVGTVTVADGATVKLNVVNEFDVPPEPGTGPNDGGTNGGTDGGNGLIPDTGAARGLLALLIAGLLMLGAGAVLVARGRRSRES